MTGRRLSGKAGLMLLTGISSLLYFFLCYHTPREDSVSLISLYGFSFVFYWLLINQKSSFKDLLAAGIILRLILLFSIPNLSQDFYRFIWDGKLIAHGLNPYNHLPNDLMAGGKELFSNQTLLYNGMGSLSAQHYSNYPPLNQLLFFISAALGGSSLLANVVLFKLMIIAADIGTALFGRKILRAFNLPDKNIFLYFLNPLVIMECTGNLHFEGVMIFFLVAGLYFLQQQKIIFSALFFALSILIKLVPLILLPFLLRLLPVKKWMVFYAVCGTVIIAAFAIFFSPALIDHYTATIGLWFTNFEFNASIYYLLRAVGYRITGYNIIGITGRILPLVSLLIITFLALRKKQLQAKDLLTPMLFALVVYFFLSTTVHPWYLVTLISLSAFTRYRFAILWSCTVIFSYAAYKVSDVYESPVLLLIEYVPVYIFLGWEIFNRKTVATQQN